MHKQNLLYVLFAVSIVCSISAHAQTRLDYKQEQSLKDATYYLDQSEGIIQQIDDKSKGWKVGDASVQIQDVQNLIRNMDRVKQYITNTDNRMKQLPADNAKVKPEAERFAKVQKSYDATRTHLEEIEKGLKGVVNQGSGTGYKADFDRLKEIAQMFGNTQIFNTYPDGAIEICKQMAPVKVERQRMAQKYADLLKQSTGEANQMNSVLRFFDEQFGQFEKAANAYAADAPGTIDREIDDNVKTARDAAAEKKLGFFGEYGGINSQFKQIETRYRVLAAIQPAAPQTAAARKKIDEGRAQVKQIRASLNDAIVGANHVPQQSYNGADKAELVKLVKAKWAESGVPGEVLAAGINSNDWQRDTYWRFNGTDTFYKNDRSHIQGFVVVKVSDTVANVHYINLVKDHLGNDKIEASFFEDPKAEVDVNRQVLLKNVK